MRTTISYEWDIEQQDASGEIEDHNFAPTLSELPEVEGELVLVRNEGNENDGLTDRTWAYVKDGTLPEKFQDSSGIDRESVPKRFHDEFRRWLAGKSHDFASRVSNPPQP